jgi:glycosyltransferase involved in cell wall biosynthesis
VKKVVLMTTHLGEFGGGENYLMRLSMALSEVSDFYVVSNWPDKFGENNGFYERFRLYRGLFTPDIFIFNSHFSSYNPIGRRNVALNFFPKASLKPVGYDSAISLCSFTAEYTKSNWGLDCAVIEPCIDPDLYSNSGKKRKIVSVGHFFEEADGHSKNQHILLDAFEGLDGYELVLMGNAQKSDDPYVQKLKRQARGKNVRIETNKNRASLSLELSTASHLWHANGYGRTDPAQTEHFGIIALEAMASGALPIVHNSGGCAEIIGVTTWERPEELVELTKRDVVPPQLDKRYTLTEFNERVKTWLNQLS